MVVHFVYLAQRKSMHVVPVYQMEREKNRNMEPDMFNSPHIVRISGMLSRCEVLKIWPRGKKQFQAYSERNKHMHSVSLFCFFSL